MHIDPQIYKKGPVLVPNSSVVTCTNTVPAYVEDNRIAHTAVAVVGFVALCTTSNMMKRVTSPAIVWALPRTAKPNSASAGQSVFYAAPECGHVARWLVSNMNERWGEKRTCECDIVEHPFSTRAIQHQACTCRKLQLAFAQSCGCTCQYTHRRRSRRG